MKEKFVTWEPSVRSLALLEPINEILESYRAQGYRLTLRQLYYQLVSRALIPNNIRSYKGIGDIVSQGRLAGLIDWSMIEDRVRVPAINSHWESPAQILKAAASSYYRDRWADQLTHVEVWCEKDAVSNVIEPVCRKWDVLFMANRGYSSQSAMYEAGLRMRKADEDGKEIWIIYLGDHDPSGIDMTRDIDERLGLFLYGGGRNLDQVERIALNMDQIDLYHPPENPAKADDSRYAGYVSEYGESSWELDALEPGVLSELVETAITRHLDVEKFRKVVAVEKKHRKLIEAAGAKLEGDA
jgi:virulence-associated protein VagC